MCSKANPQKVPNRLHLTATKLADNSHDNVPFRFTYSHLSLFSTVLNVWLTCLATNSALGITLLSSSFHRYMTICKAQTRYLKHGGAKGAEPTAFLDTLIRKTI